MSVRKTCITSLDRLDGKMYLGRVPNKHRDTAFCKAPCHLHGEAPLASRNKGTPTRHSAFTCLMRTHDTGKIQLVDVFKPGGKSTVHDNSVKPLEKPGNFHAAANLQSFADFRGRDRTHERHSMRQICRASCQLGSEILDL